MVQAASNIRPTRPEGHSQDRRWWWDGLSWVPSFSSDGTLWWDGTGWLRVPAALSKGRRTLILIGSLITVLVLAFDLIAGVDGASRSVGHDFTGTALLMGLFCAAISPVVVIFKWWFDTRPLRTPSHRLGRLVAVGLSVGVPVGFVALQLVLFKY
jgi:hypothetical protein